MSSLQAKLQHKYALSEKGAKDMIKAFVSVTCSDLVLMFPVWMLYFLVRDYLQGTMAGRGVIVPRSWQLMWRAVCAELLWQSSCVRSRYPSSEKKICPI